MATRIDHPVEYKRQGDLIEGSVALLVVYEDQPWFFVNDENRAVFVASPGEYAELAKTVTP